MGARAQLSGLARCQPLTAFYASSRADLTYGYSMRPRERASDGRVSPRGYHRGSAEQAPAPPERSRRERPPTPPYDRSRQRPPARGPAPVLLRNKEVDALYELLGWVQEAWKAPTSPGR